MNIQREPLRSYEFDTRDNAELFADTLNKQFRLNGKAAVRKSLPRFKSHINRNTSVFYRAWSIADYCNIRQAIKTAQGHKP